MFKKCCLSVVCFSVLIAHPGIAQEKDRKAEYVHSVTRGGGLMPWQDAGISEAEATFRAEIEARKDAMLSRAEVDHPAMISADMLQRAKDNIAAHDWAKSWLANQMERADDILTKPAGWIGQMIPLEPPANTYGFTCPNCVGKKSQEAVGHSLVRWSYTNPEEFSCRACGQVYPDPKFPETQELLLPRSGMKVTYYLNDAERANPEDRSGKLAWHWVGHPIHVSFTGTIREQKIGFMRGTANSLAFAYLFTEDPRYAVATRDILLRFTEGYRQWPYRDYWDSYADCDPLYAAWHDKALPLEWKRHLAESAFNKDTVDKARMLQTYWGAGRVHPSTDSVSGLLHLAMAYDLTCDAVDADGKPVWSAEQRTRVERDLLLEYIMGAEPYAGGAGVATNKNNKAPRIYNAMAAIGKSLGIPEYIDTALQGFECVRDASFIYDGFSTESPSYTNMYLSQLLIVPESLHGYTWPEHYKKRSGSIDLYATDTQLRMMYRSVLDTLRPNGQYLTLSDTRIKSMPSQHIAQMGVRRYPEYYAGVLPALNKGGASEYALFNLTTAQLTEDTGLAAREALFPAWQTAILRHGEGQEASILAMPFNPWGGHRHYDNLALFYADGGDIILGDHGYVGDMPVNTWIKSTLSHNLVVVDGKKQEAGGRKAEFQLMATSPLASVVEASSTAYPQCEDYRRRVVLVKVGKDDSFLVDLFHVKGGNEHRYRIFSELASSDAPDGKLFFNGLEMPEEPPLPQVGASLAQQDIFGLRDVRSAMPTGSWVANWEGEKRALRLHMLTAGHRVEASNGPGQRSLQESGRRVRYVDTIRSGDGLESTFVGVHEPLADKKVRMILGVQRMPMDKADANAVGVRITRGDDTYYVLHNVGIPTQVGPVSFEGSFAIVRIHTSGKTEHMSAGAKYLAIEGREIVKDAVPWASTLTRVDEMHAKAAMAPPQGWSLPDASTKAYMRVRTDVGWTGFQVKDIQGDVIEVERFPFPDTIHEMELPVVTYGKS